MIVEHAQTAGAEKQPFSKRHPTIMIVLRAIGWFCGYILHGQIVVDLGHLLIMTAGHIAETAMLIATLWITATYVAPKQAGQVPFAPTFSLVSLLIFSLLPEIILFSAIITSCQYWYAAVTKKDGMSWVWATLFSLPTLIFFVMTVVTISSFAGSQGDIQQATGASLVIRCLAGWFYALISLIHAKMPGARVSPVEPGAAIDYAALALALSPHLAEMRAGLLVDLAPLAPDLDYVALASAVAPYLVEARATAPDPVASSPVVVAPVTEPLKPAPVVAPKEPDPVASSPVVAPEPLIQSAAEPAPVSGSELEKAGSGTTQVDLGPANVPHKAGSEASKPASERDQRLAAAYADLLAEGLTVSGRALAPRAKCNRAIATEWLRLHHGGGSESSGSGSAEVGGSETSGTASGEVDLAARHQYPDTGELVVLDLTGRSQEVRHA